MLPQTFIFMGRSGCGKGTQAELLMEYLKKTDPKIDSYYLETGNGVRNFIQGSGYSETLAKKIYDDGGLFPEFLSIWIWADMILKNVSPEKHLIIDGTPRKADEAWVLDSVFPFYERKNPYFVYLNVSREWSIGRLKARGRGDDNDEDIKARLDWFDSRVTPAIDYFRNNPRYKFLDINAEQPKEKVHADIVSSLS